MDKKCFLKIYVESSPRGIWIKICFTYLHHCTAHNISIVDVDRISYFGTGISFNEKICRENFQMFLSLSFHNKKIVFKIWVSSPLQAWLVDDSDGKETHPRWWRIKFKNFPCITFPCKMSLCQLFLFSPKFWLPGL